MQSHNTARPDAPPSILSAHLVQRTPDVDGAVLDDFVHDLRDGLGEVGVGKLYGMYGNCECAQ